MTVNLPVLCMGCRKTMILHKHNSTDPNCFRMIEALEDYYRVLCMDCCRELGEIARRSPPERRFLHVTCAPLDTRNLIYT